MLAGKIQQRDRFRPDGLLFKSFSKFFNENLTGGPTTNDDTWASLATTEEKKNHN